MIRWLQRLGLRPEGGMRVLGKQISYAVAVGIVAGLGAIAFHWLCHLVAHYSLVLFAGYEQGGPAGESAIFEAHHDTLKPLVPWLLVVVPVLGAAVSGFLVYKFAPEAAGHGTDAAIDAYHNKRGVIRPRVPMVKMLASAITIGTGGSGGREGPIAQIGAGFGSFLATRLKLSDQQRRTLMASGVGAGIGAIFQAPLAGAIFSTEVLYRDPDFEAENLMPAFIASTVAYCMFNLGLQFIFGFEGFAPLFVIAGDLNFDNPLLLGPLSVLAIAMMLASRLYVSCFYGVHHFFDNLKIPNILKPMIGAALTGLIALAGYYTLASRGPDAQHDALSVMSFGYGFLQKLLQDPTGSSLLIPVLLIVGFGKLLTTSMTISSGGSGGVFGPSMVIGGALGAVIGLLFQDLMPNVVDRVDVFVILGMASFFAAAANTPVSTLIMVSEMTSGYELLLPSMWVCALAYLLGRGWSLFSEQVKSRLESPAHRGDFIVDVLKGLTVIDAFKHARQDFFSAPLDMPVREMDHLITNTEQTTFPVVDAEGKYYGLFGLNDVRQFLYDADLADLAVAQDLASKCEPLKLNMGLPAAIERFAEIPYEALPVVKEDDPTKVVALLRQQALIATYNSRLLEARRAQKDGGGDFSFPAGDGD